MIEIPRPKNLIEEGIDYRPFQYEGIGRMIYQPATLLGDDMGLGKTVQVIGACNVWDRGSVLIIPPATLKGNWLKEWKKWSTVNASVGIAHGSHWPNTDIVIINYDILYRHKRGILSRIWDVLVYDEAHYIKNPQAQRTRLIIGGRLSRSENVGGKKIRRYDIYQPIRAKVRIAVTGTPIVNRPIEIWPTLNYLEPNQWGTRFQFARRYCAAHRGYHGWDFSGHSNLDELQRRLSSRLMIRRLKAEVLTELPPKTRQVIELDQSTGDKRALWKGITKKENAMLGNAFEFYRRYQPGDELDEDDFRTLMRTLNGSQAGFEEMSTVRKETGIAKIPAIIEHLETAVESSGKVVCFCWHTEVVDAIYDHFKDCAVKIVGDTPTAIRSGTGSIEEQFTNDTRIKLLIGNIQAAGVGLNLQKSAHVVFAELDWVPGNMTQAEDRCHRYGQTRGLLVQYLVLAGSLDATIGKTFVKKQDTIDKAQTDPAALKLARMLQ